MPLSPAAFCVGKNRRCTARATRRGYCDDCYLERQRVYEQGRPSAAARGYDREWQATRAAFLEDHPTCECDDCLRLPFYQRPPAEVVDHKDGLGPSGPRGHDPSNLRSMTKLHHDRRTARDQPAGWNRRPGAAS